MEKTDGIDYFCRIGSTRILACENRHRRNWSCHRTPYRCTACRVAEGRFVRRLTDMRGAWKRGHSQTRALASKRGVARVIIYGKTAESSHVSFGPRWPDSHGDQGACSTCHRRMD